MDESDQAAKLRVETMREKRKQKILAGSQKRMNAILNADGGNRQAPCVEGMGTTSNNVNNTPDTSNSSSISRTPSQPKMKEPLDFEADYHSMSIKPESVTMTVPKYLEFVDEQRFWIAVLIGLLFAVLSLLSQVGNVLVPVLVLIFSYEAFVFKSRKSMCPKENSMLSTILPGGLNMDVMTSFGLIVDVIRKTSIDLLVVTFGFLSSRLFLETLIDLLS